MKSFISTHSTKLLRVFTPRERAWAQKSIKPYVRFACLFAVKEAVFKSLGLSPVSFFRWDEIEVTVQKKSAKIRLLESLEKFDRNRERIAAAWMVSKGYAFACSLRRVQ